MAVTDTVKLAVYNEALRVLGSRRLGSLTEEREPRRVMEDIWGSDNRVVLDALEEADWNFATRTVFMSYSTSVEPDFGFPRAYEKPDDLMRLTSLSPDDRFRNVLRAEQYADEAGYWFTDFDELYAKYVSSDDLYGLDDAKWTQAFRKYIAGCLAYEACERITNSTNKQNQAAFMKEQGLKGAKSRDAMDEGTKRLPQGSWSSARNRGRYGAQYEGRWS